MPASLLVDFDAWVVDQELLDIAYLNKKTVALNHI